MYKSNSLWSLNSDENIPNDFLSLVTKIFNKQANKQEQDLDLQILALLLWKRNIRTEKEIEKFFNPTYISDSNSIFEKQINIAIERLIKATKQEEKVAIWGDYSCDSIITTAILYTGLRNIFSQENQQLSYYFPPRNLPKFGLNIQDIQTLKNEGYSLIICASIGSKNSQEVEFANSLGIDIIIIENTILSIDKPPVLAWLNPHLLPDSHPDYYLSGGAIAFFLIQKFFSHLSLDKDLNNLLALVALNLLQEEYNLLGNNRYLLFEGIKVLKKTHNWGTQLLIEVCKKNGYYPLNIYQGINEKFKTLKGIHSNIDDLLKIITNEDTKNIPAFKNKIEKAYFIYLDLNYQYLKQIKEKIKPLHSNNDNYINLISNQWKKNILDLIAKNTYNYYHLPVVLLSSYENDTFNQDNILFGFAYGFSLENLAKIFAHKDLIIDYKLLPKGATFLLLKDNVEIFKELVSQEINQNIRNVTSINIDLIVKISDLNESFYQQIQLLESYCLNNPPIKVMIKNCRVCSFYEKNYEKIKGKNQNFTNRELTLEFWLKDDSCNQQIKAIWWGGSKDDIEENQIYDIVGVIEYQFHLENKNKIYYLRIIDLKPSHSNNIYFSQNNSISIVDYRQENQRDKMNDIQGKIIDQCPIKWSEIHSAYQEAIISQDDLILRYKHKSETELHKLWEQYLRLIKSSIQQNQVIKKDYLLRLLSISNTSLEKIVKTLLLIGINYQNQGEEIRFTQTQETFSQENYLQARQNFQDIIQQEYLQKEYFYHVKVEQIKDYLQWQNMV